MNERIEAGISNLPKRPGVYLMKDKTGKILYVGKAKNLNNRVSQYFLRPQSGKVQRMVMATEYFDTIITNSEKEALILEMNLIHENYPRYNILLKDGGHYPYISLKKGNDPVLKIARHNTDKKVKYFGPFPNSRSAYRTIDLLNKIFPLRKCNIMPKNACLYYHLGQCLAPCINDISLETYSQLTKDIDDFLKGKVQDKVQLYKKKMLSASKELNFELAGEYKNILDDIEHIVSKQNVEITDQTDRDIFAFAQREGYLAIAVLVFRHGLMLGKNLYVVEQFDDFEEQIVSLIGQYYHDHPLPNELVINQENIASALSNLLDTKVMGTKRGILMSQTLIAQQNATQGLDDHFMTARLDDNKIELLNKLGETLGIPSPFWIEVFDNSHLQGSAPVGAMVVFINGVPVKRLYRKFHIEHEEKRDDISSIREIVYRRYKRLKEENSNFPSLVVLDGGIEQVKAAQSALVELDINLPLVGLYKNEKHQTKGLVTLDGVKYDLTSTPNLFFFMVRLQDEVHRFAIAFHQKVRGKLLHNSILDGIPGLGPARQELLKKAFRSIDELKSATIDQLRQLLPLPIAQGVFDKLHNLVSN